MSFPYKPLSLHRCEMYVQPLPLYQCFTNSHGVLQHLTLHGRTPYLTWSFGLFRISWSEFYDLSLSRISNQ